MNYEKKQINAITIYSKENGDTIEIKDGVAQFYNIDGKGNMTHSVEDLKQILLVANEIEKLQQENELAKQALKMQCEIADERNQLLRENQELKEKWNRDTHKLQNELDIANAKIIDWEKAYQEEKGKQFGTKRNIYRKGVNKYDK